MRSQRELEEKLAALEYSGLVGRVFRNGSEIRSWEQRNFANRTFWDMDMADYRKGIVLLMKIREQQILAE